MLKFLVVKIFCQNFFVEVFCRSHFWQVLCDRSMIKILEQCQNLITSLFPVDTKWVFAYFLTTYEHQSVRQTKVWWQLMTRQSHWKTQCDIRWHTWRSGWVRVLTKWRFASLALPNESWTSLICCWCCWCFLDGLMGFWQSEDLHRLRSPTKVGLRGFVVDVADVLLCFNGILTKWRFALRGFAMV